MFALLREGISVASLWHDPCRGVDDAGRDGTWGCAGSGGHAGRRDEARERLILTATDTVMSAIDASYHLLRDVREILASGSSLTSVSYQTARQAHGDATRAARVVLRRELSALDM
ncbi:hypothetical protein GCM10022232_77460 [Streptomyces plumbiresistens]|uniref:Uncharacterized protein n=1 Tax=Streptomyces plumbiresistens TaxID=511811 RepID=A0ABP7T5G7_9ACTN